MRYRLLVLDIDNTVFDWVAYYVHAIESLLDKVVELVPVPREQLIQEAKKVFEHHDSIEYPFLVQELPSVRKHYGSNVDRMLDEAVKPSRDVFLQQAALYFRPYGDVMAALKEIRQRFPELPIVALTDAPRYVAMWKLNKLGILHEFSAVYGLPDPVLPTAPEIGRVLVEPKILLKHVTKSKFGFKGKIRILPEDYEKPGTRGLKTVLMDYGLDEDPTTRHQVLWVGDNLKKDVGLGRQLGVSTVWARYGTMIASELKERLIAFSPMDKVTKNVALDPADQNTPKPDYVIDQFSGLLDILANPSAKKG